MRTHELIAPGLVLRPLGREDATRLSSYFDALSSESTRRFQPHPLTSEVARSLCAIEGSATLRCVIESAGRVIGYFILEPTVSVHEAERYSRFGISLKSGQDYTFAPSVADEFQNKGIASLAMPHLINLARKSGAKSLVLMGGTQATNTRAVAFYEKFGFRRFGGYQTDVFNHDMRLTIEA
jgi:diamine N-acetyltransferase